MVRNHGLGRSRFSFVAGILAMLALVLALPAHADYLSNTELKEGFAWWHGDGEPAFLNPDGSEGVEGDKGVAPVVKISLSKGDSRSVTQTYETKDEPKSLHVRLEVFASADFKRSPFTEDYSDDINWKSTGRYFGSDVEVPQADFWVHDSPSGLFDLAALKPGQWVTIEFDFDATRPEDERTIAFGVPPGEGTIYIRNPSVMAPLGQ